MHYQPNQPSYKIGTATFEEFDATDDQKYLSVDFEMTIKFRWNGDSYEMDDVEQVEILNVWDCQTEDEYEHIDNFTITWDDLTEEQKQKAINEALENAE